jgi:hypothetical protein
LGVRLARRLTLDAEQADEPTERRILGILPVLSDTSLLPLLLQLSRHPSSRVRSKVSLLIGRINRNSKWVEKQMLEPDPRVRANAVEALWGVDSEEARELLWKCATDCNNRVAGNALAGLYCLGETESIRLALDMAAHPSADFRATAAWAMGKSEDPRFMPALSSLAVDSASRARANARRSMARINESTARLRAAGRLRVRIASLRRLPDGDCEMQAVVSTAEGLTLPVLAPTRFAVWEDSRLATDYTVEERACIASLVVAFALTRAAGDSPGSRTVRAVAACLEHKRQTDLWAIAHYSLEPRPATHGPKHYQDRLFGVEFKVENATQACTSKLEPPVVSANSSALRALLEQAPSRASSPAGIAETVRQLLASIGPRHGVRHLVLFAPQEPDPEFSPETAAALAVEARQASVALHVIAPPFCPQGTASALEGLSRGTGGCFLPALAEDRIPDLVETTYLSLLHRYRLVYRSVAAGGAPSPVQLRIHTEQGCGEDRFPPA